MDENFSGKIGIDAIVVAGTSEGYLPVGDEAGGKCMLAVGDRPLLGHVLTALSSAPSVGDIYVIGRVEHIGSTVEKYGGGRARSVPQGNNLVENVTKGYDLKIVKNPFPYALVLSGDMPLLTGEEIELFLKTSDYENCDCVLGFSPQSSLLHFENYGIHMGCAYFRQFTGRISNMMVANVGAAHNLHYLGKIYRLRYQKHLVNYLRLIKEIANSGLDRPVLLWLSFLAQVGLSCDRRGLRWLARAVSHIADVRTFERAVGEVFGARMRTCCLPVSFGALDVDNRKDLLVFRNNFEEFRKHVKAQFAEAEKLPAKGREG